MQRELAHGMNQPYRKAETAQMAATAARGAKRRALALYATHVVMLCALVAQANRSERRGQSRTADTIHSETRKLATLWGVKSCDVEGLAREVEGLEIEAAMQQAHS